MKGKKSWTNQVNFSLFYNQLDALIERFSEVDILTGNISYSSGNQGQINTLGGVINQFNFKKMNISFSYTFQLSNNLTEYNTYPLNSNGIVEIDIDTVENTQYSPRNQSTQI